MAKQADIVVGAGDFGALRHSLNRTINWLKEIDKPTVLVPGNAESCDELQEAISVWPSALVLHGNGRKLQDIQFYGLGGGVPVTPFGSWSYDFTEEQASELLLDCPDNAVLVSHSPPYGILDVSSRGHHLGSHAVRRLIENKAPRLVVCGHIHESGGRIDKLGETVVVNAGPNGIYHKLTNAL